MNSSYVYEQGKLWIDRYDQKKPFASFLPGIAGRYGIPMWVYYVNRGQLISSFGLESKDQAILDFSPANMAYRRTEIDGFRTFIKVDGRYYEPFNSNNNHPRSMWSETNAVGIKEVFDDLELTVKYFNVTNQPYPGLIRKVSLKNLRKDHRHIELVDGLATMWPYGTNQFMIKNMSNLAVAWFDVFNQERKMPLLKNRSTTEDTAEVEGVEQGNFYVSVNQEQEKLDVIFDPSLIFGYEMSLRNPQIFQEQILDQLLLQEQVTVNQLMSGFSAATFMLDQEYQFYTLFGKANHLEELHELETKLSFEYFQELERDADILGQEVTAPVEVSTHYKTFDAYLKQSFLDNLLRGGFPLVFKGKEHEIIYHIYSRIHGDMEREYNNFFVEPAYFSQGNGSYRDVNQNRRNDVYFVPEAQIFNIHQFMDLIQLDGHNPLTIQGSKLSVTAEDLPDMLKLVTSHQERIEKILKQPFTPGKLMTEIDHHKIGLTVDKDRFLNHVLSYATQEIQSVYGTGYWSDHWIYNMDLIEAYLNVFPDRLDKLLLSPEYRFYQNHVSVFPRSIKYVMTPKGEVRQLYPLYHDQEKINKTHLKVNQTNFHKSIHGETIRVTLLTKLIHLASIKFTSLDPEGMGIMMDSEKPGWNDAMNGLPAIFGSGLTETITLKRLINRLIEWLPHLDQEIFMVPTRIAQFFKDIISGIEYGFDYMQDLREAFDRDTKFFLDPQPIKIHKNDLISGLNIILKSIEKGLTKAKKMGDGILPTYLSYEAFDYKVNEVKHPELGYPTVTVRQWKVRMLPFYLEAPATYMKQLHDHDEAKMIYQKIKQTDMYDEKLGLYLTSNPLDDETLEIGRARAFTKGWLEREACFMHMSYKYLISLIKSGLYEEYFTDMKTAMPPFMDPEIYGRSPLENASFIATSNNPNPKNHGRAFVARLTGTTSEAMTLMILMMTGKTLFTFEDQVLKFKIHPILTHDFFDQKHEVSFKLFSKVNITIYNPENKNTFEGLYPVEYQLKNAFDHVTVQGPTVDGHLAEQIRRGHFDHVRVTLKSK
ncbi:MAG: cellobiose phosphorylase [Acholeplasma sp.]|nr:MAG: cellobiose phosphorylase [Acholeplasma sp.]